MKILVTGRDGQLARSLAEVGASHQLVFAGRPELDLSDWLSIEKVIASIRPDVIVNAAAYTAVDAAEDDCELAMTINGIAPGVFACAAAKIDARIIQVSTDYVFDGLLNRPYREDDRTSPLGIYGRTKLAGELAVISENATAAIFRTAWVYGPFGSNFLKTMLRLAETRNEVAVVADQIGSPTSSIDLATAILQFAVNWPSNDQQPNAAIYHAAGSGATSWAGFAREIFAVRAQAMGRQVEVQDISTGDYPTKARRPSNSVLDCKRLAAVTGCGFPDWRRSVELITRRLLTDPRTH